MLTFIIFVFILSVLVLVHELGHFYVAKKAGIKVEEFGFGIPPKLFGKKIGETEYTFNLLPLGGFVRLFGEEATDAHDIATLRQHPEAFISKPVSKKIAVIVAGVLMNLLLAIFIYYFFFLFTGFRSFNLPLLFDYNFRFGNSHELSTVVTGFYENTRASEAGVKVGDAVLEINNVPVYSVADVRAAVGDKQGQQVSVLVMDVRSLTSAKRYVDVPVSTNDEGRGILGTYMGKTVWLDYSNTKILSGVYHSYNVLAYSSSTLGNIIKASFRERDLTPVSSSVSGPVGIISVVGSILDYSGEVSSGMSRVKLIMLSILDLTAILSLSLSFINILPIPALDGGKLFFVLIEKVKGSPLSIEFENRLHKLGMLLLFGMLILITVRDITRLF